MQVSAGSCADPSIAILASVGLRLAPIGWEPSYHSINTVTDKSRRGNQPELIPLGEADMRNGVAAVGDGTRVDNLQGPRGVVDKVPTATGCQGTGKPQVIGSFSA